MFYVTFSIVLLVLLLLSIIFNTITIVTVFAANVLTPINLLIVNLTLADLVYTSGIPMFVAHTFLKSWPFGKFGCQLFICTEFLGIAVGILTVTALSVERYFEVVDKKKRASQFSNQFKNVLIVAYCGLTWFISLLFTLPFTNSINLIVSVNSLHECGTNWSDRSVEIYFSVKFVLVFLIPSIVLVISSLKLLLFLNVYSRRGKTMFNSTSKSVASESLIESSTSNRELIRNNSKFRKTTYSSNVRQKANRLVLIVIFLFVIEWSPLCVFQLVVLFSHSSSMSITNVQLINLIVSTLSYSNTVANPMIYMLLTYNFKIYRKNKSKLTSTKPSQSTTQI